MSEDKKWERARKVVPMMVGGVAGSAGSILYLAGYIDSTQTRAVEAITSRFKGYPCTACTVCTVVLVCI